MARRTSGKGLRGVLTGNLTTKLMALVIALVMWMYAFRFSTVTLDSSNPLRVPVFISPAPNWSLVSPASTTTVNLIASYPRRSEGDVDQALRAGLVMIQISAIPEEDGDDEQSLKIPLDASLLKMPATLGIRPIGFEPAELQVRLVRETTDNVRVTPVVSEPPPGYVVDYMLPLSATIRVRGRKDVVDWLADSEKGIMTETIDISSPPYGAQETYTITPLPVGRIPSEVIYKGESHTIRAPETVPVRIVLKKRSEAKKFEGIPVTILAPLDFKYDAVIRDNPTIGVTVQGPPDAVAAVTAKNIYLTVNVAGLEPMEVPQSRAIEAQIIGEVPRASELTISPAAEECYVKISARSVP